MRRVEQTAKSYRVSNGRHGESLGRSQQGDEHIRKFHDCKVALTQSESMVTLDITICLLSTG